MDTVYNDETNGLFIQTFKFVNAGVLFAVYQESKTALSMKQGVDLLEKALGKGILNKYVHILLTDRGSEFSAADAMETSADGTGRTRVFYCDPMQSLFAPKSVPMIIFNPYLPLVSQTQLMTCLASSVISISVNPL